MTNFLFQPIKKYYGPSCQLLGSVLTESRACHETNKPFWVAEINVEGWTSCNGVPWWHHEVPRHLACATRWHSFSIYFSLELLKFTLKYLDSTSPPAPSVLSSGVCRQPSASRQQCLQSISLSSWSNHVPSHQHRLSPSFTSRRWLRMACQAASYSAHVGSPSADNFPSH